MVYGLITHFEMLFKKEELVILASCRYLQMMTSKYKKPKNIVLSNFLYIRLSCFLSGWIADFLAVLLSFSLPFFLGLFYIWAGLL